MEGSRSVRLKATLGIGSAIDDAVYLRPSDGSCAHGAWFDRDIEGCVRQVLTAESLRRGCDRLYLGVRRDIGERLGQVMSATDDLSLRDDHTADGDFVGGKRFLGFGEGEAHEALVGRGTSRTSGTS